MKALRHVQGGRGSKRNVGPGLAVHFHWACKPHLSWSVQMSICTQIKSQGQLKSQQTSSSSIATPFPQCGSLLLAEKSGGERMISDSRGPSSSVFSPHQQQHSLLHYTKISHPEGSLLWIPRKI